MSIATANPKENNVVQETIAAQLAAVHSDAECRMKIRLQMSHEGINLSTIH